MKALLLIVLALALVAGCSDEGEAPVVDAGAVDLQVSDVPLWDGWDAIPADSKSDPEDAEPPADAEPADAESTDDT